MVRRFSPPEDARGQNDCSAQGVRNMNRRIFSQGVCSGAAAVLTLLLTRAPAAFADDWCSDDPLVKIVTLGGTKQYVHVTTFAYGIEHRKALHKAAIIWSVAPASEGTATDVTITTTVPQDGSGGGFPTKMLVSTKPNGKGTVLGQVDAGAAGSPMVVTYTLAMP